MHFQGLWDHIKGNLKVPAFPARAIPKDFVEFISTAEVTIYGVVAYFRQLFNTTIDDEIPAKVEQFQQQTKYGADVGKTHSLYISLHIYFVVW